MSKSTYKNLVTVPDSSGDSIVSSPNTGVGGDIVANFKAIADVIYPSDSGPVTMDSGSSISLSQPNQALNVGCNFNYDGAKPSYHILNNTGTNTEAYAIETSTNVTYGYKSGAFMKGILINPQQYNGSWNGVTLIDVPYAGAMIVDFQLIAIDTASQLHLRKGYIEIYPQGSNTYVCNAGSFTPASGTDLSTFGTFEVYNGDLVFFVGQSRNYDLTAIQIGLHGTILAGIVTEINSTQQGSTTLPSSYEST